jgi:hypothetical protein
MSNSSNSPRAESTTSIDVESDGGCYVTVVESYVSTVPAFKAVSRGWIKGEALTNIEYDSDHYNGEVIKVKMRTKEYYCKSSIKSKLNKIISADEFSRYHDDYDFDSSNAGATIVTTSYDCKDNIRYSEYTIPVNFLSVYIASIE